LARRARNALGTATQSTRGKDSIDGIWARLAADGHVRLARQRVATVVPAGVVNLTHPNRRLVSRGGCLHRRHSLVNCDHGNSMGRGGCRHRRHWLVNCDHGDSMSRGGCRHRRHSLVNCDHGDSMPPPPNGCSARNCCWCWCLPSDPRGWPGKAPAPRAQSRTAAPSGASSGCAWPSPWRAGGSSPCAHADRDHPTSGDIHTANNVHNRCQSHGQTPGMLVAGAPRHQPEARHRHRPTQANLSQSRAALRGVTMIMMTPRWRHH
jgi:hypothetical protein